MPTPTFETYKGFKRLTPTPIADAGIALNDNFTYIANRFEQLDEANALPKTLGNIVIGEPTYSFKLYDSEGSVAMFIDDAGGISGLTFTGQSCSVDTISLGGTNLATTLAGKASTTHTHSAADITTGNLADARLSSTAQTRLTLVGNATASPTASTLVLRDSNGSTNVHDLTAHDIFLSGTLDLDGNNLLSVGNATSSPTGSTFAFRDALGGVQFTTINATTVDAPTIQGTTVNATNGNLVNVAAGNNTIFLNNGAKAISVEDGDGLAYMSVSPLGAITAPSLTLNGTSMANARQISGLADPNADRILFWDDSAGAYAYLAPSTGLTISGTNMSVLAASETQSGIAETATSAEVAAGTDTLRYIPPAYLSSITKLGTIATGTWQATAIADSYISSASTWNAKVAPTRAVNTTAPLSGGGALSSDLTLSISAASGSAAGSMSSAHYSLVNGATTAATNNALVRRSSTGGISVSAINTSYIEAATDLYLIFNTSAAGSYFTFSDGQYGDAMTIAGHVVSYQARLEPQNGFCLRFGGGTAPATAGAAGTAGDMKWDSSFIYVCTATNTWKRAALASW